MTRRRRRYRKPAHSAPRAPRTEVFAPPHRRGDDAPHETPDAPDIDETELYLQMATHAAALLGLGYQLYRIHKSRKLTP